MIRKLLLFSLIGFFSITFASAQSASVAGSIKDSDGLALIGANVVLKGTTIGTITDIDGNYSLPGVPLGSQVVVASFIGYNSEEAVVELSASGVSNINFVLIEDVTTLDELIVIGYGTQKKEDKTGAVAQVGSDDLIGGAITDPLQAIAGKAAGVVVTKAGGNPTDDAKIKIRGSAGMSGDVNTNPLYVIDGIPGADPNMLAPGDIESMNILKDAASTAIYGSQGANGVILIKTKSGKSGVNTINFSSVLTSSTIANKVDLMSASDYRTNVDKYGLQSNFIEGGADTDWQDEIFRTAFSQQYNLSASGGSDKGTYYASLAHQDNEGIIKNSDRKRTIANVSFTHKGFNDKLLLTGGVNTAFEQDNLVTLGSNSRDDILYQTYRRNPTDLVRNADGSTAYKAIDPTRGFDYVNPVGLLEDLTRTDERKKFMGNVAAEYEIVNGLKAKVSTSYLNKDKEYTYYRERGVYGGAGIDKGEGQRYFEREVQKTLEATINYNTTFSDVHNLDLLGGYSWYENTFTKFGVEARNSQSSSVGTDNMESFLDIQYGDATSEAWMSRLIGYFGRVNYNYDNKYYVGASIRTDGSSKFGENNKWGLFPTASIGWNMHREGFLDNASVLSQLKLRGSFGVSGNQAFNSYYARNILEPGTIVTDPISGEDVLVWQGSRNPNPNLQWEETSEINFGIDFGFFDSRLSGSFELYSKNTSSMLYNYSVPNPPAKFDRTWLNSGEMTNQGFELFIMGTVIDKSNIQWKTTVGLSKNAGKITSLGEYWTDNDSQRGWISGQGIVGGSNWTLFLDEGQPIGDINVFKFSHFEDGAAYYHNLSKEDESEEDFVTDSELEIDDRFIAGNTTPQIEASWSNSFTFYKNWSLDFTFRGLFGQKIYNHTNGYFSSPIFFPYANVTNQATEFMDQGYFGQFTVPSDLFVEDGSFVRLEYLALGYTFNFKKDSQIKALKLSAMANNLFIITNYSGADPEMTLDGLDYGVDSFSLYPKSRTISFGLNATF